MREWISDSGYRWNFENTGQGDLVELNGPITSECSVHSSVMVDKRTSHHTIPIPSAVSNIIIVN